MARRFVAVLLPLLLAAGCAEVRRYEFEPSRLHVKTMIVDRHWVSVGSANLDRRSFTWNYEANLIVFNEGFARQMEQIFERDPAHSQRVTLAQWRRRPWSERLLETMYGVLRSQY